MHTTGARIGREFIGCAKKKCGPRGPAPGTVDDNMSRGSTQEAGVQNKTRVPWLGVGDRQVAYRNGG